MNAIDRSQTTNLQHAGTAYLNPGFTELAEALKLQSNHHKVVLVFDQLPHNDDRFIITNTLPYGLNSIASRYSEFRKWQVLFALAPHLFLLQKVIYTPYSAKTRVAAALADRLFGNNYHKKLVVLNPKTTETIQTLKPEAAGNSILFQEYRFNLSRFFIGVLRIFSNKGGSILFNPTISGNRITVPGKQVEIISDHIVPARQQLNDTCIYTADLPRHFVLIYREKGNSIRFLSKNNCLYAEQTGNNRRKLDHRQISEFANRIFYLKYHHHTVIQQQPVPSIHLLTEIAQLLHQPFPGSIAGTLPDNQFELCQEKYDQAKQAGITWNRFRELYHRYGSETDEITETAYELMGSNPDTSENWENAELYFQQKYEWKNNKQ